MRRLWAAGAAMFVCLGLGGVPAAGQTPSFTPDPRQPAVAVTGTASYSDGVGGTVTKVGLIRQTRDVTFSETDTVSDPRVSGEGSCTWNQDAYPGEVGISWGMYRLENEGGAWSGTWTSDDRPVGLGSGFLVGEGGYEGLTYDFHQDGDTIVGLIFPGAPPMP
jgi:hypothetical protein